MPHVVALYRYPVKGFNPEECETLTVLDEGRIAGDRVLGIPTGQLNWHETQNALILAHAWRVSVFFEDIGDLDRFPADRRSSNDSVSQPGRIGTERGGEFLFHVIGGAQLKLFGGLVVFVNRSAVGAA